MRILVVDAECVLEKTRYPIKDSLEEIGHKVDMFDWSYYFPRHTDPRVFSKINSKLFENIYVNKINRHLCSVVSKVRYDLVLIVMGRYIYPDTIKYIKNSSGCVANWNSDDIFNVNSSSDYAKRSLSLFDIHFTPRPHLINEYKELGAKHVVPLGWYHRPGLMYPSLTPLPLSYEYPVSFIGSWSAYRESCIDKVMPLGTNVFGWGWANRSSRKFQQYCGQVHMGVSMAIMHNIFNRSKININLLTKENRNVSNLRNFEIPAAIGFQLAERSDEVLSLFEEDREIVCFSGPDEMAEKCEYYLRNEKIRCEIARAGHNRLIKSNYTLTARVRDIISHVEGYLQ